jgi:hypothetical protein
MSTIDIVYLSGIVGAFVIFAVVLGWVQYQTRHVDAAKLHSGKAGGAEPKSNAGQQTVSARWPNAA